MDTTMSDAIFDIKADDGIEHTIWRVPDALRFTYAFRDVPFLYIADGHHRAASASRARAALRDQNPEHTGEEEYNYFLVVLFPADQLQILPYNRVVRDLGGRSKEDFLAEVRKTFRIEEGAAPSPQTREQWSMYLDGLWYGLTLGNDATQLDDPVASLDVSVLQDQLLNPILGIEDVRTDKRIDFVGGARGTEELERLVNEGRAAVAFSLYPTTVDDLLRVSDKGSIMPPKSTWFEPKLRDGLLIHTI
jgi:uncharacterized protein (DUF1015 family)